MISVEPDQGLYLVVVVDAVADTADAYGPLRGDAALQVAHDTHALLTEHGPTGVVVTMARFHQRAGVVHPDDP